MLQFSIDAEACVKCGECVKTCPVSIIRMPEDSIPAIAPEKEENCMKCQQCLAVCPTAALSINGKDPLESTPLKGKFPTPDQMEVLIKGRRSTRRYKKENVAPEIIDRLMETAAHCPTGKNNMDLLFTLVDNKDTMEKIRKTTMEGIRERAEQGTLPEGLEFFEGLVKIYDKGNDIIFRGAPHMVWVTTPKEGPSVASDVNLALAYFELMAATLGLGTVWCGFALWAMNNVVPEVRELLGIPPHHTDGYVMMFGTPEVRYHRTVQRGEQQVNVVKL